MDSCFSVLRSKRARTWCMYSNCILPSRSLDSLTVFDVEMETVNTVL